MEWQIELSSVRKLIAQNKLREAIQQLGNIYTKGSENDKVCNFSAMFYSIREREANGTIAHEQAAQNMNKLRLSMLEFLTEEDKNTKKPKPNITLDHYSNEFQLSLTRIVLGKLFLQEKQQQSLNLTITAIQQFTHLKSRKFIVICIKEFEQFQLVEKLKTDGKACWKATQKGIDFFSKFNL